MTREGRGFPPTPHWGQRPQTRTHWGQRPQTRTHWGQRSAGSHAARLGGKAAGLLFAATLPIAVALFAPIPALAVSSPAEMLPNHTQELRAEQIGAQLRCLVCQNMTIEDSDAPLARDLRRIVRQHVVAGESNRAIIAWMTARYGDFVRLRPPFEPLTWILWFSPILALGVGLTAVLLARRRAPTPPPPLSAEESARLQALLHP